ncbi:MAG: helix-hairpin-helix domain-containing protein [Haliscomenobacteraceae bacterium CHB4]|nr:helix-hairpin-helix domain-containing protein [Haliscomenobacteraceae bacterium CHB4]
MENLKNLFHFTRKERLGVVALMLLCAVVFLLPEVWRRIRPERKTDFTAFQNDIARFKEEFARQEAIEHARQDSLKAAGVQDRDQDGRIEDWEIERQEKWDSTSRQWAREKAERRKADSCRGQLLNVNTATAADFERLPGIGPTLAGRIVKFRAKLGRFPSVETLARTYGLPDSTFRLIRPCLTLK